ncbi:MAG: glycoside hydrolase family 20 zincin-like fold domain-containing protein [Terracidiphilus sp.]
MRLAADQTAAQSTAAQPPYRITLLRNDSGATKAALAANNLAFDPTMESAGYILVVGPHEAAIIGATGSGVFYGVQTFKQLLPLAGAPRVHSHGHGTRLAGDAISRHQRRSFPAVRFPTLEFQKHQIRVFATFKINIYSPYFENTLLYPDHPLAAPPGGSLTPAQVAELVAYAPPISRHHRAGSGGLWSSASCAELGAPPGQG